MKPRCFRRTGEVEALQWTGDNQQEIKDFVGEVAVFETWRDTATTPREFRLVIRTLEDGAEGIAKHVADVGDWIIRGVEGECWAVKPHIFAATYEPVVAPTSNTLFADLERQDSRDANSQKDAS